MVFKFIEQSKSVQSKSSPSNYSINLFSQFFIPDSTSRLKEIQTALKNNVNNTCINSIYLLNEKQ